MAFFDTLGKTLSNTGKDMTQKAKEFTETTKLNMSISQKEEEINRIYQIIGKKVFEMSKAGNMLFPEEIEQLNSIESDIQEIKRQILNIKGLKICTHCNNEINRDATFCSSCGEKIIQPKSKLCTICNAALDENSEFCAECGSKIQEENNIEQSDDTDILSVTQQTQISTEVNTKFVCSVCGEKITAQDIFCPDCGTRNENKI